MKTHIINQCLTLAYDLIAYFCVSFKSLLFPCGVKYVCVTNMNGEHEISCPDWEGLYEYRLVAETQMSILSFLNDVAHLWREKVGQYSRVNKLTL